MFSVVYILLENPKALTGSPFGKNLVYFVFFGGGAFFHIKLTSPTCCFLKILKWDEKSVNRHRQKRTLIFCTPILIHLKNFEANTLK